MKKESLEVWVTNFLKAWAEKNIEAVLGLLADQFEYYETPFDEPLREKTQVAELWKTVPENQTDIFLSYETLAVTDNYGLFRVSGSFVKKNINKRVKMDAVYLVAVDERGLCTKFRQWYEGKEEELNQ